MQDAKDINVDGAIRYEHDAVSNNPVADFFTETAERATELARNNPKAITVAGVALAVGAIVAAAIPAFSRLNRKSAAKSKPAKRPVGSTRSASR